MGAGSPKHQHLHVRSLGWEIGVGGETQLFKTIVSFQTMTHLPYKVLGRDLYQGMTRNVKRTMLALKRFPKTSYSHCIRSPRTAWLPWFSRRERKVRPRWRTWKKGRGWRERLAWPAGRPGRGRHQRQVVSTTQRGCGSVSPASNQMLVICLWISLVL